MAEILVRAHESWMDNVPQIEKDKWDTVMWAKYNRRRTFGNPISVRPDGSKWGKKECPPRYIIVKIPGLSVEEASIYLKKHIDNDDILLNRKYMLPSTVVDNAILGNGTIITSKENFEDYLIDNSLG